MPPRIRSLKPEIWQDKALGRLPRDARLLFVGIITQADDEGRFRAETPLLRAAVFPFDTADTAAAGQGHLLDNYPELYERLDLDAWIESLANAKLIRIYEVKGERFGDLPNWSKHQRVDHPKKSNLPPFEKRDKTQARQGANRTERNTLSRESKGRGTTDEQTSPDAGDSRMARDILATDLEGDRDREVNPVVEQRAARPGGVSANAWSVWQHYRQHHPHAKFTTDGTKSCKSVVNRALRSYDIATLKQAIDGNHLDPHCNGDNDRGRTYHSFELCLRDAAHIEQYADIAQASTNGDGPAGESRLARARRRAAEREGGTP